MDDQGYAVVMAGGRGERFWPLSTSAKPKQLLSLVGGKPLVTLSVERLAGLVPMDRVFVITTADLTRAVRDALPGVPPENVIGEPFGRDTAAACALGLALVKARDPAAAFCVLTADHVIKDLDIFRRTLADGLALARQTPVLITIGIEPAFPSTGFGYIEAGDSFAGGGETQFFKALRFVEKPDEATARKYVERGNFYWNSGMFMWSVPTLDQALSRHAPPLHDMARNVAATVGSASFADCLKREYAKLEKISVDYALMEKADNILMARGAFGWDDVGAWIALENHFDKDTAGNVTVGTAEFFDARDNLVVSEGRLTAMLGVENLVVVHGERATLVCHRDRVQDVKKLLKMLEEKGSHDSVL